MNDNFVVDVKKLHPNAKMPVRATPGDAGADLCALEKGALLPGERTLVDTGLSMEIPVGYYGRIAPRSGLAVKYGIDVMAGVLDSTYRGPVKVCLVNLSNGATARDFRWEAGDRIAQLIIEKCALPTFEEVIELSTTIRGAGGFGSTGS
jgi:dUTP pyrophosphatase